MGGRAMAGSITNARRRQAWIVFQDESGISEQPSVRRTWAPKGETPVLIHAFNWKKLSVCAALGYRWDGRRFRLWFQTRPGSYNAASLIGFLKDLKKHLRGQKAILVWDGLPAHKSREMQDYLETQNSWLEGERLPGYSPDLNPVEPVGGMSRGRSLPTAARRTSANREPHSEAAWKGFGGLAACRFLSCTTRVSIFDQSVTVLCEIQ